MAVSGEVIVAVAIFAHAWTARIQGPPAALSAIGWVVNVLAAVALLLTVVRR